MIKNTLFILLIAVVHAAAIAEEAAPPAPTSASSEDDLRKSLQREYVYLVSQKEALSKQKGQLTSSFNQRIGAAKSQTESLQKELVKLTTENDDNHEYLMNLERRKKDLEKRGSSLESTYKKSQKSLAEFDAGLRFEAPPQKSEVSVPEDLKFSNFDDSINRASELLVAATRVESFPSSFLDLNEKLVDGTVTRIGRSAAIGSTKNAHYVLGPSGDGLLKALEVSKPPGSRSLTVYIFESLNKIAKVKKAGGFTEKLADLSPILFLAVMLMLVAGLFVVLIRI